MIKSYLKTAWKHLVKGHTYSILNISGLTIGLAVGILILLWVQDERSFDRYHSKGANIYRVNSPIGTGHNMQYWPTTQAPVATRALHLPGVRNAVRMHWNWEANYIKVGDKSFKAPASAYADPGIFTLFDFKWLQGDPRHPFPNERSVVISRSLAKEYFGDDNPIGKILTSDHKEAYTITGLMEDMPANSSFRTDLFFSMALIDHWYDKTSFWKSMDVDWGNFGYATYLEVEPGTSLKTIGEELIKIQAAEAPHIKVDLKDNAFLLQPLADIHLYGPDGSPAGLQTVIIFTIIAVLILAIACINYVNLSTARSMIRAKEVSIRKIIGATKRELFGQFIIESVLYFVLSLMAAVLLIWLIMPLYNKITAKEIQLTLSDPQLWKIVLATTIGTLLASAIYPSLLLSSFRPLQTLRGKLAMGVGNASFRKILVTVQFTISMILIIGTLVISRQLKYIREKDPGYDRSQVFTFQAHDMRPHLDAIRADLSRQAGIASVSTADNYVIDIGNTTGGVDWTGKDPNSSFIVTQLGIDARFIPFMKMEMAAGHNFTGIPSDTAHFILNETAVRMMGISEPVGKRFKFQRTEGSIIGVVKDFNGSSLKYKIEPTVLYYEPRGDLLYVRTNGRQAGQAIAAASRVWTKYNPGLPFEYTFLDESYERLYRSDQRTGALINIFTVIAILISCLGLLGLVTYTAQVKTREIGIRKVLGASIASIVSMLSLDFLKLVALAICIASPFAWWAMHSWLQHFAYRTNMSWWIFGIAGASAIGIAALTLGFQSVKAALANPVKSLRTD